MELNDAIAHERKEAEVFTETSNALYRDFYQISLNCQERANYHEQVAAWLEELAEYRKLFKSPKEAEEALHRREECREFISKCHVPTHRKEEKE